MQTPALMMHYSVNPVPFSKVSTAESYRYAGSLFSCSTDEQS